MEQPPMYLLCPHCEHPAIVPAFLMNDLLRCRQCAGYYRARRDGQAPQLQPEPATHPNPQKRAAAARSIASTSAKERARRG